MNGRKVVDTNLAYLGKEIEKTRSTIGQTPQGAKQIQILNKRSLNNFPEKRNEGQIQFASTNSKNENIIQKHNTTIKI